MISLQRINENKEQFSSSIIGTLGTFDGVHLGHQAILSHLVEQARTAIAKSLVITFSPHPLEIVNPTLAPQLLTTPAEREQMFAQFGIDFLDVLPFDHSIAELTPQEFIQQYLLERFLIKRMCIGYDHGFGHHRSGTVESWQAFGHEHGFTVDVIMPLKCQDMTISSTKIRQSLHEGDLPLANLMLGRPYSLRGVVVHGDKRGRQLGFPTANVQVDHPRKLIPKNGVYAVAIRLPTGRYLGVMNIGIRPTLNQSDKTIEIHVLDFNDDIYDQIIEVEFRHYLRPERKFNSLNELATQIQQDIFTARQLSLQEYLPKAI